MRYVGLLLTQLGLQTENDRADVSTTLGISDNELLQYMNDGQTRLQTVILRDLPHLAIWDTTYTASLVASQPNYNISGGDAFYDHMVRKVEYREVANEDEYYQLDYITDRGRSLQSVDRPSEYAIRKKQVWISPIPSTATGNLRITYVQALDKLDKRRGKVSARTSAGGYYTDITLENDSNLDSTNIALAEYLCVTNSHGVVSFYNIPIGSYNPSTRVITVETAGAPTSGGTITVGDYITLDKYTTTHSKLPDACERYLLAYGAWKIFRRDSSSDAAEQNEELAALERDIITGFSIANLDLYRIPVTDPEWFEEPI